MKPGDSPRNHVRHGYRDYGPVPRPRCRCVVCIHARMVREWCPMCQNVGLIPRCWTCFRVPGATTDDPALAA
jgi:hypothetical protein